MCGGGGREQKVHKHFEVQKTLLYIFGVPQKLNSSIRITDEIFYVTCAKSYVNEVMSDFARHLYIR